MQYIVFTVFVPKEIMPELKFLSLTFPKSKGKVAPILFYIQLIKFALRILSCVC